MCICYAKAIGVRGALLAQQEMCIKNAFGYKTYANISTLIKAGHVHEIGIAANQLFICHLHLFGHPTQASAMAFNQLFENHGEYLHTGTVGTNLLYVRRKWQ